MTQKSYWQKVKKKKLKTPREHERGERAHFKWSEYKKKLIRARTDGHQKVGDSAKNNLNVFINFNMHKYLSQ